MKKEERNKQENILSDLDYDSRRATLFTGDYIRDSAVSELEKAADAAQTIYFAIREKKSRRK